MGYGLSNGKWTGFKVITWNAGEGRLIDKHAVSGALDIWQEKLGITFQQTQHRKSCDFKVSIVTQGTAWVPANKVLSIKTTDTLGTLLHEIGHLLGIYHEQDRPDVRKKFYPDYAVNLAKEMQSDSRNNPEHYKHLDFAGAASANVNIKSRTAGEFIEKAENSERNLSLKEYGGFDKDSIMQYPESKYLSAQEPSEGDVSTAKKINGW